jgi:hypothetical protein
VTTPTPSEPTRLQVLLERRLGLRGETLEGLLTSMRADGATYELIAGRLRQLTDRHVTANTIWRWCRQWGIE